jgi:FecR-like protein
MNLRASRLCLSGLVLVFAGFAALPLQATAAKKNNPTSKFYVADLTGDSAIDDGTHVQTLAKNAVHSPEGSIVETKAKSSDSLVLSNGTALYIAPETRVEFKRFLQEPFTPNRNDLDIEPSISHTLIQLLHGGVGVCTSQLVAGSSMVYQTPQATINIRGRRLVIQTDNDETRVALLEGDVTVIGDPSKGGEILHPGQRAIVRRAAAGQPYLVTVEPITEKENAALDEMAALACISRRTVFFESVDRSDDSSNSDLVPVRATAATPPTQFTVSPARINQ